VNFFHTGVKRRKYKLGQTKQILLPKSRFVRVYTCEVWGVTPVLSRQEEEEEEEEEDSFRASFSYFVVDSEDMRFIRRSKPSSRRIASSRTQQ